MDGVSKVLGTFVVAAICCLPNASLAQSPPTPSPPAAGATAPQPMAGSEGPRPAVRPVRTGGLQAEVAAIIMSGQQGGQLATEVLAFPADVHDGKVRVPVLVEVGARSLLASHQKPGEPLVFEIFIYALTPQGGLQDSLIQTYEVDVDRLGDKMAGGFKFEGDLDLRPGEYSLRVLVRNPANDSAGLRIRDLEIPGDGQGSLSVPFFTGASSRWLGLREGRERGQTRRPPSAYLGTDGRPAVRPVVQSGEPLTFRVLAHQVEPTDGSLTVRAIQQQTGEAIILEGALEASAPDAEGLRWLTVSTDLAGVGAGLYRFEVSVADGDSTLQAPPLPVVVLPRSDSLPEEVAWSEVTPSMLRGRSFDRSGPAVVANSRERRRRARALKSDSMRQGYRAVVDLLADGRMDEARVALFDLTLDQYKNGQAGLEALAEVELEAAVRVAEFRPPGVAPLLTLHHWLYQDARRHELPLVSTHARTVTLELVELYLRTGMSIQAKRQTAAVLVSLGCELQRAGMSRLGERLLQRVLTLDPGNDVALLSLGAAAELRGEYDVAVAHLNDLVDQHPNHGEGRLRLAVNQLRDERRRGAIQHLEALIAGDHRPWILALAYQERAKLLLERDKFDEAHELLLEAVERVPSDEKLRLQLAFVQDARLDFDRSRETLQAMELRSNRRQDDPRHVYTQWPETSLYEIRRALEAETETLVADLERALAQSAQATGGR